MTSRAFLYSFAAAYVVMAALLAAASAVPAIPYNMREVLGGRGLAAPLLLPLVLSLLFGTPVLAAARLARGSGRIILLVPAAAISTAIVCYVLLRFAVPMESIWDIVGAPVLAWPWEWELLGRFVALAMAVWLLVAGGACVALGTGAALLRWAAASAWALPLCYAVIVPWAATDNLTELIAGGGSPLASLSLGLFLVAMSAAAGAVWQAPLRAGVAFVLAHFLLRWGTEQSLTKYGATFSALQFLLSPDREHYVTGPSLVALTVLAQGVALVAMGAAQAPYWLQIRPSRPEPR